MCDPDLASADSARGQGRPGTLSRRELLRRAGLTGATALSVPLLGAVLEACGGGNSGNSPNSGGSSKPNGPAIVNYAISTEPKVLTPPVHTLAIESTVMGLIFSGLLRMTTKGTFEPNLAESYSASSDYMTYRFTLRNGLRWQDGKPVTAQDWKFTWQVYVNPKTATSYLLGWDKIDQIETPDDRHIVVHMKAPYAAFLLDVGTNAILPQHILQPDFDSIPKSTFNRNPVGCGPFKLASWQTASQLVLEANPLYWRGRPKLDQFIFKIVPNATTQLDELQTGTVDLMSPTTAQWDQVQSMAPEVAHVAYPGTTYVLVQLDEWAFLKDARVRQALDYATPKTSIVKSILKGLAEVAYADVPPESPYHNPQVEHHDYDLNRATALLGQAGFSMQNGVMTSKDGKQLEVPLYTISSSPTLVQVAEVLKESWLKAGVKTDVQTMEASTLFGNQGPQWNGKDAALIYSWGQGPDPNDYVNWNSSQIPANADASGDNDGRYSNAQVDRLTTQGQIQPDMARRKQIYSQLQQILARDVPAIFLYWPKTMFAYNAKLKGFQPNAYAGALWNAYDWTMGG